jgi:hypothetical protein
LYDTLRQEQSSGVIARESRATSAMKSQETGLQAENDEAVQQLGRVAIGAPAIHT